jgi:serine/threonine-protein kinase HipA
MPDIELSVWTRASGEPVKMGRLYVTDVEARFTYSDDFPERGLPGLSLIYPPALFRDNAIVHRRAQSVHPRFRALIPPAGQDNFQRRLMLAYLRETGIHPSSAFEEDLALLAQCGHGGIGHVDVFADDSAAENWYRNADSGPLVSLGEQFGFSLKEMISWLDADARLILESLGPTPSVGGAIPKLLVAIPAHGWDGRISLPNRVPRGDRLDVVLKIERTSAYPGLVALEALTLDVHREAGFDAPRYWRAEAGGLPALAVARFDRDEHGLPVPLESLYSILAAGARDIEHSSDGSLDRVGAVIELADPVLVADKKAAREHLFRRLLLALLTGNGDLHLDNLSLLGPAGRARFSPVYDPTPMRAYTRHDMLCAVPFGGYGERLRDGDALVEACRSFATGLGLRKSSVQRSVTDMLAASADYPDRLETLDEVPVDNRRRLQNIHGEMRARLQSLA